MAGEKERVDAYQNTVSRLEPEIAPIDASAFYASAAISLKRLADAAERMATAYEKATIAYITALGGKR
jgi:hypothetical protein